MRNKLPIDNLGVAGEWDYELNAPLIPDDFSGGSEQYVWWKCKKCGNRLPWHVFIGRTIRCLRSLMTRQNARTTDAAARY